MQKFREPGVTEFEGRGSFVGYESVHGSTDWLRPSCVARRTWADGELQASQRLLRELRQEVTDDLLLPMVSRRVRVAAGFCLGASSVVVGPLGQQPWWKALLHWLLGYGQSAPGATMMNEAQDTPPPEEVPQEGDALLNGLSQALLELDAAAQLRPAESPGDSEPCAAALHAMPAPPLFTKRHLPPFAEFA